MKKIPLRNRHREIYEYALVDDEDYEKVIPYNWHIAYGVARTKTEVDGNPRYILMHRLVLDFPPHQHILHFDHNRLNNCKANLGIAARDQELNKKKGMTSRFRGCTWNKKNKKFQAQLMRNKKLIYLGTFVEEVDAARAYNNAALKLIGPHAFLNKI